MKNIRELWNNRKQPKGRIDITYFFVNLYLLICHIFLMAIYIMIGHRCMIAVNIFSTLIYASQIFNCYKNTKAYVPLTFFEIWFHMVFAVLSFGWTPCFQNWSFALIAAYFLPTYSYDDKKRSPLQSFIFSLILVITYFVLSVLIHIVNIPIAVNLNTIMTRILFTLNNLYAFISITVFALFYTSTTKRKEYELTRKADYDELTDLYNRHAITQLSKRILEDSKKYNVAIIDIDYFKKVNDQYGHNTGDLVLKEMAKVIKDFSTSNNLLPARWGGEEFVIISTNGVSYTDFKKHMERIRKIVEKHIFKTEDKKEINITISIGVIKEKSTTPFNDGVKLADKNLYKAKKSGRNRVIW